MVQTKVHKVHQALKSIRFVIVIQKVHILLNFSHFTNIASATFREFNSGNKIMTLTEYFHLKEQVIKFFGENERHSQLLSDLKELYRDKINSPRRYELITSIGQLLRVLEVRDVLSESNIQPLKEISLKINNTQLFKKLQEYEQCHVPGEHANYYSSENTQQSQQQPQAENLPSNNPYAGMSEKKIQRIKQTVVDDIGTYWRDLARSLSLKEDKIDKINDEYKKVEMKAKHVLEFYLENLADPQTWFFDLCEGLELSSRKDLAKKLKKISLMNI